MKILEKPFTQLELNVFIDECNKDGKLRVERYDGNVYAMYDYEVFQDGKVIDLRDTKEYEVEQAEKERERIQELFITRSDFFDATIKAFGADGDDLLLVINKLLPTLQIDDVSKKIALNNFKNAQNFYRKHTLFTLLSDVDIPIAESKTIRITSEQWDNFFDKATNEETKADAYKELLPREE